MSSNSSPSNDKPHFTGLPPDSPGSSVSSTLQEEYDELLKYAVVVPSNEEQVLPESQSNMPLFETLVKMVENQSSKDHARNKPSVESNYKNQDNTPVEDYSSNNSNDNITIENYKATEVRSRSSVVIRQMGTNPSDEDDTNPVDDNIRDRKSVDPGSSNDHSVAGTSQLLIENDYIAYTGAIDPDIARLENILDEWTLDLKRNILAEFGQSKIRLIERHKEQMLLERQRHAAEMARMQNDLENVKELLNRYENTTGRKDQVVSNLAKGMQKLKEKNEKLKAFCEWRISHNESKQESFACNLAEKHYYHLLTKKCFNAWHSLIENKWRNTVERACQSKAKTVCLDLTNAYESQISGLNSALESARFEISKLRQEREKYEETMKKAFMRGVCALNMEAMSMFNEKEEVNVTASAVHLGGGGSGMPGADADFLAPHTHSIPHDQVFNSEAPGAPVTRITPQPYAVRSSIVGHGVKPQSKSITTGTTKRPKSVPAQVSAKVDTGRNKPSGSTQQLVSSFIVERHQPVNEIVSRGTVSHYGPSSSKTTDKKPTQHQHIHKVKIVE